MIARAACVACALAGSAGLSQYPAFTDAYVQNLTGRIDELGAVIADFDASAARADLTRAQALAQMTGTQFLDLRQADMRRAFARYEALVEHHAHLSLAAPMERLTMAHRLDDRATLTSTWEQFQPAMPLSGAGAVAAGAGGAAGWTLSALLISLIARPFRRRRSARTDPPLHGGGAR
ncbi:MAG: DUF2937 family protein [Paracoccaceae bacterium]